jgi:hypothetical protein
MGFVGYTSFDATFNGEDQDAFAAKLSPDGQAILYAGFIGGALNDGASGIAVDGIGHAYVIGSTCSNENSFPDGDGFQEVPGRDQTFNGAGTLTGIDCDAFVVKVHASGEYLAYATYLGGSGRDRGSAIAVDLFGYAYVIGTTSSGQATFPVLSGPDLTYNGNGDGFVAKLTRDGLGLVYSGYLGSSGIDGGNGIALRLDITPSGHSIPAFNYTALVTGTAGAAAEPFPVSTGPDTTHNGGDDAFVARVRLDGSGFHWFGFIGGSNDDEGMAIAVDANDHVYVAGATRSSQASFPVLYGPDMTYNGNGDGFVAKVRRNGSELMYTTYLGGNSGAAIPDWYDDVASGIAVDGLGNAYVAGQTRSSSATFPTGTGFGPIEGPDSTYGGSGDGFFLKISELYVLIPF